MYGGFDIILPLSGTRGSWRNWLAHWTVDPGVAGSSPVDPASTESREIASWCNGSTADSDSACWGSSPCEATIKVEEAALNAVFLFLCFPLNLPWGPVPRELSHEIC